MPRPLLLLLALGLAGSAAAQTPIRLGQTLEGRLDATDARGTGGAYYDAYSFRSDAAGTVTVFLRSDSFDAYLFAGTGMGDAWTQTHADDDGGGALNSRLVLTLGAGQTIVLRASALSEGATGAYTLSVEAGEVAAPDPWAQPLVTVDPARIRPLGLGTSAQASFEAGGDALFRFTPATAGTFTVVVDTADFDAMLQVGTLDGTTLTPTSSDDDSGTDNRPLVVIEGRAGVPLVVRVTGYAEEGGAFGLRVLEGDQTGRYADGGDAGGDAPVEVDPAQIRPLALDTPVSGTVTAGGGVLYRFSPPSAGTFTIVVDTSDFDAMLQVGTLAGTTFTPTSSDDDSGRGLNPLLIAEADAGMPLYVRVLGFTDSEGPFGLRVLEGDQASRYADTLDEYGEDHFYGPRLDFATAVPVQVGTTRRSVGAGSPALEWDERRAYDLLRFDVPAAGPYTFVVTSDAFDPSLEVGRDQEVALAFEGYDDDAGVGRAAALVLDLAAGPYYLRVVSDSLGRGAYTLELREGDHGAHVLEANLPDRVALAQAVRVGLDQAITGRLDGDDPVDLPWDSATDLYLFEAQAGQTVTIEVESTSDVDPYVEVGSLDGDVFTRLAADDDGMGEGLNSRITFTFEHAGRYLIRVSAINEVPGGYILRVRR
jgi:hypothetical protein